ncbi:MAG: branched-chain amino acid ABC transporter permease LivH [Magnetococcales bacterium]|nr:branched-chain amino acid ABC transporter permease LivH [Magnetococcales bacterium]NGZ28173.1 branched-chain amino acid ABC transporter permease LivH [Magnetococcales bacterium]
MDGAIILQQLINGLALGSIYGLIAVGYTMVYGVIGMINFAHGEIYMISAYFTAIFLAFFTGLGVDPLPWGLLLTLTATLLYTGFYGWVVERVAYKPLRRSTRLAPFISAIGVSLLLQNYARISQGARTQGVPALLEGAWRLELANGFVQVTHVQSLIWLVSLASMGVLAWLIGTTPLGRACRATQQDPIMAQLLGIDIHRTISAVFIMGAVMAAVAGVLVSFNYGSFDFYIGFITGIKAFTAAVLGGIGSLPGAMLGGVVLGLAESLFSGFINTDYKDVFAFSLLILVLIFRPSGILGRPAVEKV